MPTETPAEILLAPSLIALFLKSSPSRVEMVILAKGRKRLVNSSTLFPIVLVLSCIATEKSHDNHETSITLFSVSLSDINVVSAT